MKRRDFLHAGVLGFPLAPQALAQTAPRYTGKPALKITDIQTFLVGIESRNRTSGPACTTSRAFPAAP